MLSDNPFEDEELGDENPELTLKLSRLARKAVEWVSRSVVEPIRSRVEELRKVFRIESVGDTRDSFAAVLAVDSTWSTPPLELVSGSLVVIVAGYVITVPGARGFHGISYVSLGRACGDSERFHASIELRSKILELETARKVLDRFENVVDLALIDGAMPPAVMYRDFYSPNPCRDPVRDSRGVSGPRLASFVATSLARLVKRVDALDVPLVGVVKRVSSRFLEPFLREHGFNEVANALRRSNDKLVMSYVLKPCEYLVVGTVAEVLEKYLSVAKPALLEQFERMCRAGDEVSTTICEFAQRTAMVYYRPCTEAMYPQAVRLDVYPADRVPEVVSYAMKNSSHTSVPIPIDLVDRYVRIEASSVRRFHELMKSLVNDPDTLVAIGLANPQKHYLYTRWVRRLLERNP